MAYTQNEIDELISCNKKVTEAPKQKLRLIGAYWRNDMKLVSDGKPGVFAVFFRKSEEFKENFSIGISYDRKDGSGEIVLLRCNGQHGVFGGSFDPQHPHWGYHIHRASEAAVNAGLKPEKQAELTTAYASYEEAVPYFLKLINLDSDDSKKHFPESLDQNAFSFESAGE